jgi:cation diffusion facilitator CzcD-associated flavoprotein CzcO
MTQKIETIIIGVGQAGLATSYCFHKRSERVTTISFQELISEFEAKVLILNT